MVMLLDPHKLLKIARATKREHGSKSTLGYADERGYYALSSALVAKVGGELCGDSRGHFTDHRYPARGGTFYPTRRKATPRDHLAAFVQGDLVTFTWATGRIRLRMEPAKTADAAIEDACIGEHARKVAA